MVRGTRIEKLRKNMAEAGLDRVIVSAPSNLYYYIGQWPHPGERFFLLLVGQRDVKLVVNQLIPVPEMEGPHVIEVVFHSDWVDWPGAAAVHIEDGETVGLDRDLPAGTAFELAALKPRAKMVNGSIVLDALRAIKEPEEIALMRESSRINDAVMKGLIESINPDWTENDMGNRFVELCNSLGTDYISQGGGISYGLNSADPHHPQGDAKPQEGDNVLMDIGAPFKKYHSDMTRTVFYKGPPDKMLKVYETVLEAQLAGIEAVKPGTPLADIDAAARRVIEKAGFGEYFVHRLGHAIGLEIHEPPYVAGNNPQPALPGMIFSVEPGIYLPKDGAVRIEDLVLVTETGHEVLNHYPKELRIV
jgi:Xaa-Pro dipeptidase